MYLKLETNNPHPRECGTYIEIINVDKSIPIDNTTCFFEDMPISNEEIIALYQNQDIRGIFYNYKGYEGCIDLEEVTPEDIILIEEENNIDILKHFQREQK